MECLGSPKGSPIYGSLPGVGKSPRGGSHASLANLGFLTSPRGCTLQSQNLQKVFGKSESGRHIYARRNSSQPLAVAVANTESKGYKYSGVGTPHEPSSPEGKFLSAVLQNQRHLFKFAVSEQLGELASDRDGAAARDKQNSGSMESLLHRRIAKMKENECQLAVEDVMYMSIVHKFSEVEVPMVPKLSKCISNNTLEIWPSKCKELESLHSLEEQELIQEHVAGVLRLREKSNTMEGISTTKIDKLHLGRIYAASIMYGYFLKSACFRRQLNTSLASTEEDLQPLTHGSYLSVAESYSYGINNLLMLDQSSGTQVLSLCQGSQKCDTKPQNLKSYVKGFDPETLQRCAKIKSKEAVNVVEKHTWGLFGDEKIGQHGCDNSVAITLPSLERLVLEAVAFGSFLWDVEKSVDSAYGLKEN